MKQIKTSLVIIGTIVLFAAPRVIHCQPSEPQNGYTDFITIQKNLISEVLSVNPGLKSYSSRIDAAKASAGAVKFLDPPQLSVEFMQSPISNFPNLFKNQMEIDYALQQMIPFPGKLSSMVAAENKNVDMAKADHTVQEKNLGRQVASLLAEIYLLDRKAEINRQTSDLMAATLTLSQKQYAVGTGSQTEVLRSQTELAGLAADSVQIARNRIAMVAMVNALRNKPVSTSIPNLSAIEPPADSFDLGNLITIALENRAELTAMQSEQAMQSAKSAALRKELLPDFMVKATYKQMIETPDDWALMVGATLPIAPWAGGKSGAMAAAAGYDAQRVGGQYENMKNMIAAEVADALSRLQSARSRMGLAAATSIPKARATLASAQAAYANGKGEYLMLLDIQRMLAMAELDYQMAVMELLDGRARLEQAVGLSMDQIKTQRR